MEPKMMTWRELKAEIEKLTDSQLDMKVLWCGVDRGGVVNSVEVLQEDHINPSGDAWEPISAYPEYADEEPIVGVKGQPILHVDD